MMSNRKGFGDALMTLHEGKRHQVPGRGEALVSCTWGILDGQDS